MAEPGVAPFYDARLASSASNEWVEVINPSTGKRLLSIPAGCEADVNRAVASARRAFDDGRWSDAPPSFRKEVLHRLADLIGDNAAELDGLDAEEMGKPVGVVFCNAASAAGLTRFYAEAVDKVAGDVYTSDKSSLVFSAVCRAGWSRQLCRGTSQPSVPY